MYDDMPSVVRQIFIISDLHLGGAFPTSTNKDDLDRGFRMMTEPAELARFIKLLGDRPRGAVETELVINGDFVDFLAEPLDPSAPREKHTWTAFRGEPREAAAVLRRIAEREGDKAVFAALATFMEKGHRLTILLGNHDVELSFPEVRRELAAQLRVEERNIRFIYDGEAYVIGDALIEHGNRYDRFNVVDHDGLRRLRSLQSRRQTAAQDKRFRFNPPSGSELVVKVMNRIKSEYPFVDLLKPETSAAVPTLRTLAPEYGLAILAAAAKELAPGILHGLADVGLPSRKGDIAARGAPQGRGRDMGGRIRRPRNTKLDRLELALDGVMDADEIEQWVNASESPGRTARTRGDISTIGLLRASSKAPLEERLPELLDSLRKLRTDASFEDEIETEDNYFEAAHRMAREGGFRYVVFGHTHLAKQVSLQGEDIEGNEGKDIPKGARYLNSGTWCDLIDLPRGIFLTDEKEALEVLAKFAKALKKGAYKSRGTPSRRRAGPDPSKGDWLLSRPTYVRLDLNDEGKMVEGKLVDFEGPELALMP